MPWLKNTKREKKMAKQTTKRKQVQTTGLHSNSELERSTSSLASGCLLVKFFRLWFAKVCDNLPPDLRKNQRSKDDRVLGDSLCIPSWRNWPITSCRLKVQDVIGSYWCKCTGCDWLLLPRRFASPERKGNCAFSVWDFQIFPANMRTQCTGRRRGFPV